jgi:hypothetical protein
MTGALRGKGVFRGRYLFSVARRLAILRLDAECTAIMCG